MSFETSQFALHERLAADCLIVGDWPLCRVLLMNDSNYPWLILVPRRAELREIYQLDATDRAQFLAESCALGEALMADFAGDKLNVAALGNMVPQLHIHHVVRKVGDAAWPAPVWGKVPAKPYEMAEANALLVRLRTKLSAHWQLQL